MSTIPDLLVRLGEIKDQLEAVHSREVREAAAREDELGRLRSGTASSSHSRAAWPPLGAVPDDVSESSIEAVPAKTNMVISVADVEPRLADDPARAVKPTISMVQLAKVVRGQMVKESAGHFLLRPIWGVSDVKAQGTALAKKDRGRTLAKKTEPIRALEDVDPNRFVMAPQSRKRLAWDLLSCALLSYDVVVIPMHALSLPRHDLLTFMQWFNLVFWSLDIAASFLTGFFVGTTTEMRFKKIARAYARTWLPFDMCIVLPDWLTIVLEHGGESGSPTNLFRILRGARFLRAARFLRLVRLLRLVKLRNVVEDIKERANSDVVLMVASVARLICGVGVMVHALACAWYFVGDTPPDAKGVKGWVHNPALFNGTLVEKDLGNRYMYAFQWSLARLHPAHMSKNMELETVQERLFSIFATVNAMVVTSIFISHITNRMAEVKRLKHAKNAKLAMIRTYAQKHCISTSLVMRLKKYIMTGYAAKLRGQDEAELMEVLPNALLMEMRHESYAPLVSKHAFFTSLGAEHPRAEADICHRAMRELNFLPNETVFFTGAPCTRMLFVARGAPVYELGVEDSIGSADHDLDSVDECRVQAGLWLSEAALWTAWENCGVLRADADSCGMLAIGSEELGQALREHPKALADVVLHAKNFLADLNGARVKLSDLPIQLKQSIANILSVWGNEMRST